MGTPCLSVLQDEKLPGVDVVCVCVCRGGGGGGGGGDGGKTT